MFCLSITITVPYINLKLNNGANTLKVIGLILGGGEGSRLQPLTNERSKPAVPLAGKYRLVDIPISNCINSDINKIYLLTQFNSVSLHEHIQNTYRFDQFSDGYVQLLAAQQTPEDAGWFTGTADAVRKVGMHYRHERPDHVVILSGDQLYRMDFKKVLEQHLETNADVTIATKPVPRDQAGSLGIMQVGDDNRIINFVEKPGDTPALDELRAPLEGEQYLASMGIYVFKSYILDKLLDNDFTDFGKNIIPMSIKNYHVCSYIFDDYWRDIGTIGSFHEANLDLTDRVPEFTFYDENNPIYTHMRYLAPSKIEDCQVSNCLLSEGCIISKATLHRCIIGIRAIVGEGSTIRNTVLMGSDYYQWHDTDERAAPGIGKNCFIEDAIIDKNASIGDNVTISPKDKKDGASTDYYYVRNGIIVIPKNAIIPAGTVL